MERSSTERSSTYNPVLYALGKLFFSLVFKLFFSLKASGTENIPAKGSFILASNHLSYLDPPLLGSACPRPLNYMARDSLFKNPVFGWILRRVGVIALKRRTADLGAIKEALARLEAGAGLILFPEGTRSTDGKIHKGLEGVGFLARKSGAPVIPAHIQGTDKALPKGSKSVKRCRLEIAFGQALDFGEGRWASDADFTQEVMRRIALLGESF